MVGWFPKDRRGLAMGIRQMSQPLGVTIASLTIPTLAANVGIGSAVGLSVALNGVLALILRRRIDQSPAAGSTAHR